MTGNCPFYKPTQILTAAGRVLPCDNPADVITAVPMTNNSTGEQQLVTQLVCLHHSINIAVWKLIENVKRLDREHVRRVVSV